MTQRSTPRPPSTWCGAASVNHSYRAWRGLDHPLVRVGLGSWSRQPADHAFEIGLREFGAWVDDLADTLILQRPFIHFRHRPSWWGARRFVGIAARPGALPPIRRTPPLHRT